jgi:hypothetical protein
MAKVVFPLTISELTFKATRLVAHPAMPATAGKIRILIFQIKQRLIAWFVTKVRGPIRSTQQVPETLSAKQRFSRETKRPITPPTGRKQPKA